MSVQEDINAEIDFYREEQLAEKHWNDARFAPLIMGIRDDDEIDWDER